MSRFQKLLLNVLRGTSDTNIRFVELCALLESMGFTVRIKGSHFIYTKEGIEEIINIQSKNGMAKAYQVKQIRAIIIKYHLGGNNEPKI